MHDQIEQQIKHRVKQKSNNKLTKMAGTRRSQCRNPDSGRHDWFVGLRQLWPLSDGGPESAAKSPNSLIGTGNAPGLPGHERLLSARICADSPRLVLTAVDARVVAASLGR